MTQIRIAFSKLQPNYENWIKKINNSVETVDLYPVEIDEAVEVTRRSSGLILTGGSDIHPARYGKDNYLPYCRNIDERRDELELLLIRVAFDAGIPILGICRGLQILNVALGGTLVPDIPEFTKSTILHADDEDVYHQVRIIEKSRIYNMTGTGEGMVNSSHHQCIDNLAAGFRAVSYSADNIIEAVETDRSAHPFCIAVQWHPERMDVTNSLSCNLGLKFLENSK